MMTSACNPDWHKHTEHIDAVRALAILQPLQKVKGLCRFRHSC